MHRRGADDDEVERGERCRQHQHRRPRPECDQESGRRRERHGETASAAQRDGEVVPEGATQRRASGVDRHRREPERLPRALEVEHEVGGRDDEGGERDARAEDDLDRRDETAGAGVGRGEDTGQVGGREEEDAIVLDRHREADGEARHGCAAA